ncbi:ATP-dependent nuclease [Pseudomonas koreensis]|uniref:ATP-dependent nuclease n=1 Tax=Pseudomonas koreensis TaxID=198620 RepID=UPI00168835DC|nr:AAA family ATPase [Pseudomonas koreensis]
MPYRIQSVQPKGGVQIELGQLTVLVGPNNCGKSQTLKDIRQFSSSGRCERLVVLDSVSVMLPTENELRSSILIRPHPSASDHISVLGVKDDLLTQMNIGPQRSWFEQMYASEEPLEREILESLGTCLIAYLGAEARFNLTASSPAFNPREETPSNALQSLFASDIGVQTELRHAFSSAFKMDIALDWAAMTRLYLRVKDDFGSIPDGREELNALMTDAQELEKQGDGFRSFAGIALALLTYPTRVLLLDEPEAFLHPAQARVLGRWIGAQTSSRQAQVIIATHSADFLAGLIAGSHDATILRLNRTETTTLFHKIPQSVITGLIESPLLSSQPVLDSLFHRGVIICEGDPDRAVYQTVAQRFYANQHGEEFLFIHSNGKDAAKLPAKLLRESGTAVCVIADFDILNSEATVAEIIDGLQGLSIPEDIIQLRDQIAVIIETKSQAQSLEELRANVLVWLDQQNEDLRRARKSLVSHARAGSNKWDLVKKDGISFLPPADAAKAHELLERLSGFGLFVVPCGELESWMHLGRSKGSKWNQAALQALHANSCPDALKLFVGRVLGFLAEPTVSSDR